MGNRGPGRSGTRRRCHGALRAALGAVRSGFHGVVRVGGGGEHRTSQGRRQQGAANACAPPARVEPRDARGRGDSARLPADGIPHAAVLAAAGAGHAAAVDDGPRLALRESDGDHRRRAVAVRQPVRQHNDAAGCKSCIVGARRAAGPDAVRAAAGRRRADANDNGPCASRSALPSPCPARCFPGPCPLRPSPPLHDRVTVIWLWFSSAPLHLPGLPSVPALPPFLPLPPFLCRPMPGLLPPQAPLSP